MLYLAIVLCIIRCDVLSSVWLYHYYKSDCCSETWLVNDKQVKIKWSFKKYLYYDIYYKLKLYYILYIKHLIVIVYLVLLVVLKISQLIAKI